MTPEQGEHTDEILGELGYEECRISWFHENGFVYPPEAGFSSERDCSVIGFGERKSLDFSLGEDFV